VREEKEGPEKALREGWFSLRIPFHDIEQFKYLVPPRIKK